MKLLLSIIDAENDFCDLPEEYRPIINGVRYTPSLPITGAHEDCKRIASFINEADIDAIELFQDTHLELDMGHISAWMYADGSGLTESRRITLDDLTSGNIIHRIDNVRMIKYLDIVQEIYAWPVHCKKATFGQNIHQDIMTACTTWEFNNLKFAEYIEKGIDPWSEHYSALQAEVVDANIPSTGLRVASIEKYKQFDMVVFVGEASSHCVMKTILDAVNNLSVDDRKKLVILTDCMSAIPGFEKQTKAFFDDMSKLGLRVTTSVELLQDLTPDWRVA